MFLFLLFCIEILNTSLTCIIEKTNTFMWQMQKIRYKDHHSQSVHEYNLLTYITDDWMQNRQNVPTEQVHTVSYPYILIFFLHLPSIIMGVHFLIIIYNVNRSRQRLQGHKNTEQGSQQISHSIRFLTSNNSV